MASSIISDYRLIHRVQNADKYKSTASTNNLIRDEVSDYYINVEGNSESSSKAETHDENAKLLTNSKHEQSANNTAPSIPEQEDSVETNGIKEGSEEESLDNDESAALLDKSAVQVTSM